MPTPSQHQSNAGWIPIFLLGAILLSIGGFVTDKLIGIIQQQQHQLELERTEQKGFERGLQFQSSTLKQFYTATTCVRQQRSSGRRCHPIPPWDGSVA